VSHLCREIKTKFVDYSNYSYHLVCLSVVRSGREELATIALTDE
jgi:hypothetical protein